MTQTEASLRLYDSVGCRRGGDSLPAALIELPVEASLGPGLRLGD